MTTYDTGTVSVGAGSTAVTGTGTSWATAGVRAGDMFMAAGLQVPIATVNSATSITLKRAWPGSALSGANYDIALVDDGVRSLTAANALLQQLTNGKLTSLAGVTGAADKMPYFTGASTFGVADLTSAARAILALTGSSGAKIPVVTAVGAAALRDILGTVSQSGGTPTGAILEKGSNANGEYVRFADGTQICWSPVFNGDPSTAIGSLYRLSAAGTWTLPAAFVNTGYAVAASANNNVQTHWANARSVSATSVEFQMLAPNSQTGRSIRIMAVGRWF